MNSNLDRRIQQTRDRADELIRQSRREQSRAMTALSALVDLFLSPSDRRRRQVPVEHDQRSGKDRRQRQMRFEGPDRRKRAPFTWSVIA